MRKAMLSVLVILCATVVSAQTPPPTVEYYHLDAAGSVRAVTNQQGQVIRRHDYFPFGEEYLAAPGTDPIRFSGKERDAETGLDYFGARYYASRAGRFTTVDPLMDQQKALVDPQQWNRYAYVRNNPLRYTDPDGRAIETLWDVANIAWSAKAVWDNPGSVSNWGALVLDVGATVLPGVPAIGGALRIVGKADDVAESAVQAAKLQKQLASEAQMAEAGRTIAGAGSDVAFRDAGRVAQQYGGDAADWVKKSSTSFRASDGTKFETHWVENVKTGERVEFKTKASTK